MKMAKMMKNKGQMPPDPDPEHQDSEQEDAKEAKSQEALSHKFAQVAQLKQKPPSIAAMIKIAGRKKAK